ncbi:MAG TPA: peptidase, partial [Verrucomicrobiales bacterium]|nr:peptidase [Verrucomicrobiales bacterium]
MNLRQNLLGALCGGLGLVALAETVPDREGAVRQDRAVMTNDTRWIYNDVTRGFAEARQTGKPLLVVLRCVPCLACGGIDGQVIDRATDLGPLLDQFVCVRVITANALDLARFQFDYDLSFSTVFFNGDGTVYGRFGSWTHQKNAKDKTTEGYRRTLEAILDVHRGYPANQASLSGKQGGPVPFRTPVEMPTLTGKYRLDLDWQGKVVPSCVHCHQIGDAFRASFREKGETIPERWIYPQPSPETVGLVLAPDRCAQVQSVVPGSIAAQAGVQPRDSLKSLAGQPVASIADVSWVLHQAPEFGALPMILNRDGQEVTTSLSLPRGWRRNSDISGRVGTWGLRGMATGGLVLDDLSDTERARHGLGTNGLALRVKYVGQYGHHAAGKKAGFQAEDIVIELDGQSSRLTEGEM